MPSHELAQLNIAQAKADLAAPLMADFVANLDRINGLADAAPGFIWRLIGEPSPEDAAALAPNTLVNLSVWRDLDTLRDYAFRSAHADMVRRRREWFDPMDEAHLVLWWVPGGHRPTVAEAIARLIRLRAQGPGPDAFTFRATYPAPMPLGDAG